MGKKMGGILHYFLFRATNQQNQKVTAHDHTEHLPQAYIWQSSCLSDNLFLTGCIRLRLSWKSLS
uniref:Gpm397a n=1 Tax=Arundo donax TaxID=35708 RepID=A0A0A9RKY7_ARUDO